LYSLDELVTCWLPAAGEAPSEPYKCGNPPCYKVLDPASEHASDMRVGAILMAVGFAFLLLGCCCFCRACTVQARMRRAGALTVPPPPAAMAAAYSLPAAGGVVMLPSGGGAIPGAVSGIPIAVAQPVGPPVVTGVPMQPVPSVSHRAVPMGTPL
jgi:hypothetical protein